jgi:hypothetical protein
MTAVPMQAATVVGEVPDESLNPPPTVLPPTSGGPVDPTPPKDLPLEALSKQELLAKATELGIPVRGNMLKSEILTLIKSTPVVVEETLALVEPATEAGPVEAAPETVVQEEHVAAPSTEAPAKPAPPAPPAAPNDKVCADCGKDLAGEKADFVKLSYIKYRRYLCEDDYMKNKAAK